MIRSFKDKALKRLFTRGETKGISAAIIPRVQRVLDALDGAESPHDVMLPGFHTHPLKGDRKGTWAITITRNQRVTFRFDGVDVTDVQLEDYH